MSGYNLGGGNYDPNTPYGAPQPPPSLTNQIHQQTAPAFHVLESLVSAFSSLAQLFESTYMATHSSFFAMVGVADQFGGLKTYLGQVLGFFSLIRLGKKIIAWLKGERGGGGGPKGNLNWAEEWKIGQASGGPGQQGHLGLPGPGGSGPGLPGSSRPSIKPLVIFFLSAVGLPYLMTKLVRLLTRIQEQQNAQLQQQQLANGMQPPPRGMIMGPNGPNGPNGSGPGALVPAVPGVGAGTLAVDLPRGQITFARALYPFETNQGHELALKRDEIVAILQRFEEGQEGTGKEMGWWRGRTRDGRVGWFPSNYVSSRGARLYLTSTLVQSILTRLSILSSIPFNSCPSLRSFASPSLYPGRNPP